MMDAPHDMNTASERLQALEAELAAARRSEEHFRHLAENSHDLLLLTTPEGCIHYASPSSERILGQPPEALTGRMSYELILPEDMPIATAAHMGALQGAPPQLTSYRARHRDGHAVWLEVIKTLVADPVTGAPYVQSVSRDVTDRKVAEAEAARYQALKDQFLSIMSHELRTPINAIMGFASILEDELDGPLNEEQRSHARKILKASDRLLHLVNDMLDMSRLTAGKFSLNMEELALGDVLDAAVAELAPAAAARSITLTLDEPQPLPLIQADAQRLVQVVRLLLGNAVKFTPPGGLVTLRGRRDGAGVRVEVSDTGPGIAPEDRPRLFEPFSQLDMTSTRQEGGLGLGLSLARALIKAHGGTIGVESQPGHGATFWFTLPEA
jgi:PAS domain S-box-containing protein